MIDDFDQSCWGSVDGRVTTGNNLTDGEPQQM